MHRLASILTDPGLVQQAHMNSCSSIQQKYASAAMHLLVWPCCCSSASTYTALELHQIPRSEETSKAKSLPERERERERERETALEACKGAAVSMRTSGCRAPLWCAELPPDPPRPFRRLELGSMLRDRLLCPGCTACTVCTALLLGSSFRRGSCAAKGLLGPWWLPWEASSSPGLLVCMGEHEPHACRSCTQLQG